MNIALITQDEPFYLAKNINNLLIINQFVTIKEASNIVDWSAVKTLCLSEKDVV